MVSTQIVPRSPWTCWVLLGIIGNGELFFVDITLFVHNHKENEIVPYDVFSYKRLREASDSASQSSSHSESPESLQKLRRHHRFTSNGSGGGDNQLRETAYDNDPSREDHYQPAIIDHDGQFKMSPSGQKKANQYFEEVTQGMYGPEKQIYLEKLQGYTKTRNKVTLQQRARYLQLYNESDGSDHSEHGESDEESEDNRSTRSSSKEGSPQRDAEPERDEGTSSHYREYRTLMSNSYFSERYVCNPIPGKSEFRGTLLGGCAAIATTLLLLDQGIGNFTERQVATSLGCDGQRTPNLIGLLPTLKKLGKVPYLGVDTKDVSTDTLRQILDTGGYSIIAGVHEKGEPKHIIVIDKITDTDVYIRDSWGPSIITLHVLERTAMGYVIPNLRKLGLM